MRHLLWIVLVPALAAGNGKVWTVQHPDERLMRLSLVGGEIIGTAGDDVVFVVPAARVVSLQSFRTADRPVARVLHGIGAPFHGMGGPVGLAVSALVHGGDKNRSTPYCVASTAPLRSATSVRAARARSTAWRIAHRRSWPPPGSRAPRRNASPAANNRSLWPS